MAAFTFKAIDKAGKSQSGVLEAATATVARQSLRGRGLLPIEVAAVQQKAVDGKMPARTGLFKPVSTKALTLVTRQFATLVGSGVRVEDALDTIAQQQPPRVAGILLTVRGAVMEGRTLGDALGDHPQVFSEFYRASVRAGEESGRLDKVMEHLASFVENRGRNSQTVQLALLYPALLASVSLAIITLLLTYVVPDIVRVFTQHGSDLPLITRALIAVSAWVRNDGLYAVGALFVFGFGFSRWLSRPANRLRWDWLLAEGRLTSGFVRQVNAAQFAGTLATLVQSGVPLLDGLTAAAGVTPNRFIRARVVELTDKVRQGSSLRRAASEANCFPPMLVAMIASGEIGNSLGGALERAANDQHKDLDALVRTLVALVEPAILLVMGGLVMAMVLAILLPIIALNNLVGV